jgi:hypothetical protein
MSYGHFDCEHDWVVVLSVPWQTSIGIPTGYETIHRQCLNCDRVEFRDPSDKTWEWDDPDASDFCYTFIKYTKDL